MKINLTDKELCILYFCVKELANRCRESKYTTKISKQHCQSI